jgi:selenide,water dikinase
VPLLAGVRDLAKAGHVTGASGRNYAAYGADITLPTDFPAEDKALLSDPQTSGGLLVSCAADCVEQVLEIFHRHGFAAAAEIGEVTSPQGSLLNIC